MSDHVDSIQWWTYPSEEEPEGKKTTLSVGETVYDDLTSKNAKIVKIEVDDSDNFRKTGIWLDNEYLGGGRHPWEISKIEERP